ncbi:MAG: S-layer homology domain-containing protein, partial [Clostridia bacterium]|nr:S-layer homology domain-containing protein [Clostridia bacterium]
MTTKKLLSGILCIVFLLSTLSVSALTFSDVENDPGVQWAKPDINAMADAGYLKGYEDGTFKPNHTISKTESLILLARMIGVNDEAYADSLEYALSEYESTLKKYSTNYKNEVSFLLYAGILKEDELSAYLSSSNKNAPLLRYEAAILLTKLLGAEDEVKNNAFVSSSYADTIEIPDSARAYVEYVKEAGIMQGMGNNEKGQPEFWPNSAVTRSQMAKMLHSLIDVLDLSVNTGVIVSVDEFEDSITATINNTNKVETVEASTKIKINGKDANLADLSTGMLVKLTYLAGKLSMVENYTILEDTVIYGLVSTTKDSGGIKSVTIADA